VETAVYVNMADRRGAKESGEQQLCEHEQKLLLRSLEVAIICEHNEARIGARTAEAAVCAESRREGIF
jgi:hypothetical protein